MKNDDDGESNVVLIDLSQDPTYVGEELDRLASGIFGVFLFEKMLKISTIDQLPISPNRPQLHDSLSKVFGTDTADDLMDLLLELEEQNNEMDIIYLQAVSKDVSQASAVKTLKNQRPPKNNSRRDPHYDKRFAAAKPGSKRPRLRIVK